MSGLPMIEDIENEVRNQAGRDLSTRLSSYSNIVFHLNHGVSDLTGSKHDRGVQFLHGLLLNRAFNSLWRGGQELQIGYPLIGLTLARSAFKDWGTTLYVKRHPEVLGAYLQGLYDYPRTGDRPPLFGQMWADVIEEAGQEAKDMYSTLCEFSHPRALGFSWLVEIDKDESRFRVGPWYDRDLSRMALHNMTIVATLVLASADALREAMLGEDARGQWRTEAYAMLERSRLELEADRREIFAES